MGRWELDAVNWKHMLGQLGAFQRLRHILEKVVRFRPEKRKEGAIELETDAATRLPYARY